MPRHRGRKKGAAHAKISTESSLLKLPLEIRNQIYDLVCCNSSELDVSFQDKKVALIPHSLARACRQLRSEFGPVYEDNVFEHASTVTFHVTNLDVGGDALNKWISVRMSRLGIMQRKYRIKSDLDHTFDQCLLKNGRDALKPWVVIELWSWPTQTYFMELEASLDFDRDKVNVDGLRRWMWKKACPVCNPTPTMRSTPRLHALLRDAFARFNENEAEAERKKTIEKRRKRLKKATRKKAKSKKTKGKRA